MRNVIPDSITQGRNRKEWSKSAASQKGGGGGATFKDAKDMHSL